MITLQFDDIEEWSYEEMNSVSDLRLLEAWPRGYLSGRAFFGAQRFIIDLANFSGDYPILGFARQLNIIAVNMMRDGSSGWYTDPGLEKESTTIFKRKENSVVISEVRRSDQVTLFEARLALTDFAEAATTYLSAVMERCLVLVPRLAGRDDFQDWLFDFSDDGTRPFSNR